MSVPAFVVALSRGEATTTSEVTGGLAVVNDVYPVSHEQNRLLLTAPTPWDVAVADAERVQGGAGLAHRRVDWLTGAPDDVTDDAVRAAGWQPSHAVFMHLDGPADASPGAARTVPWSVVRPAVLADWREALPDLDDDGVRQLADRREATARACGLSWHVVLDDEDPVSWCSLRVLDLDGERMAQVEEVMTLPSHQGRGFARNVVAHAVGAARAAGAGLVWLEADRDDWPRELYSRIGFEVRGPATTVATRSPSEQVAS
ncbi:hypothetical protein GCM10027446_05130 [Angustibacter peucedani]